jgi:hypothetical protein
MKMNIHTQEITDFIQTCQLKFDDLELDVSDLEDFIGFSSGFTPEPFIEIISEILNETNKLINPLGGYAVYDHVQVDTTNKQVIISDVIFKTRSVVTRQLDKATSIAVFACTAGAALSELAAEHNRKGNTIHAYMIDSLGSIAVERAMDIIQENLKTVMAERGLRITNRYSPGYCNWNIREQEKLFGLLPANFCGISLTESLLMKPIKSVSGVIGIGHEVTFDNYSCDLCKDKNCIYRNKGSRR